MSNTKQGYPYSIFFTGERNDVPELLSVIDVLVSSSLYEGLSNAILEGMAAAKPIVATAIAGNPELVLHEQTGFLVPPGQPECLAGAIIGLLDDRVLRKQMGYAGRKRVEELFQMDKMVHNTEKLYTHLVGEHAIIS